MADKSPKATPIQMRKTAAKKAYDGRIPEETAVEPQFSMPF
jgi:hypothetical protein